MTRAGQMKHRGILYRPNPDSVPGTRGEETADPIRVGRAMVMIETLGGQELEMAQKQWSSTTHRITMRFRRDVAMDWWIEVQNAGHVTAAPRKFHFGFINNVMERNEELAILCKEEGP